MRCVAYTDGSYCEGVNARNEEVKAYGMGVYIKYEDIDEPEEISWGGSVADYIKHRNITGECVAVMGLFTRLEEAYPKYTEVDLYFDLEGIEHWVTRKWEANKPLTLSYRDFMWDMQKKYKINFHNIRGHVGILFNERADQLAKNGAKEELSKLGAIR